MSVWSLNFYKIRKSIGNVTNYFVKSKTYQIVIFWWGGGLFKIFNFNFKARQMK